jgi:hypothetical protein
MFLIKRICRFFCYWWESVSSTKDVFDKIARLLTVLAWLIVVLKEWADFPLTNWEIFSEPNFEKATWFIAILLTLRVIFWLPFKRHEELNNQLQTLQKQILPAVKIEEIKTKIIGGGSGFICQFHVRNKSKKASIDDVKVELAEIKESPDNKEIFRPKLPLLLYPQWEKIKSINPDDVMVFNLFWASQNQPKGNVVTRYLYQKEKYGLFEVNKHYPLEIKITARDFSPVVLKLNLNFSDGESGCYFNLSGIEMAEAVELC